MSEGPGEVLEFQPVLHLDIPSDVLDVVQKKKLMLADGSVNQSGHHGQAETSQDVRDGAP
jgi:hypothetical protein